MAMAVYGYICGYGCMWLWLWLYVAMIVCGYGCMWLWLYVAMAVYGDGIFGPKYSFK
jgi:hypothetical protein